MKSFCTDHVYYSNFPFNFMNLFLQGPSTNPVLPQESVNYKAEMSNQCESQVCPHLDSVQLVLHVG